jgi:hypothetical protein
MNTHVGIADRSDIIRRLWVGVEVAARALDPHAVVHMASRYSPRAIETISLPPLASAAPT